MKDEIPSMTPRPTNDGSSDGSLVLMIVVVVPASAGTLLVITLLIIYRHCTLLLLFSLCIPIFLHLGSKHSQSEQEKCDVVENSAYGVHVQGSAGDSLEPDYNMENNPLYEMRILSNERHSQKTETPAPVPVYETVDIVTA